MSHSTLTPLTVPFDGKSIHFTAFMKELTKNCRKGGIGILLVPAYRAKMLAAAPDDLEVINLEDHPTENLRKHAANNRSWEIFQKQKRTDNDNADKILELIVSSVTPYVASSFHHLLPSVHSEVFTPLLKVLGDVLTFLETKYKIHDHADATVFQSRIHQVDDRYGWSRILHVITMNQSYLKESFRRDAAGNKIIVDQVPLTFAFTDDELFHIVVRKIAKTQSPAFKQLYQEIISNRATFNWNVLHHRLQIIINDPDYHHFDPAAMHWRETPGCEDLMGEEIPFTRPTDTSLSRVAITSVMSIGTSSAADHTRQQTAAAIMAQSSHPHGKNDIVCFLCGQSGHTSRQCPKTGCLHCGIANFISANDGIRHFNSAVHRNDSRERTFYRGQSPMNNTRPRSRSHSPQLMKKARFNTDVNTAFSVDTINNDANHHQIQSSSPK